MTGSTSSAANILVADDTPENLRLLVTILAAEGHQVRAVTGGLQALAAAEREPPDLVLLDINMPDLNGFQVCTRLKQAPALAEIPVLFLTALSDITDIVRGFEVGGVDYITKPFQLDELLARVRTHLALRHSQRELRESLEKLRALERMRDDLVHMLVHDMRSPLMAILGHLAMLEEDAQAKLEPQSLGDLAAAAQAAEDLTRMTNDLIDVSRLEAEQLPLNRREHDLAALIRGVAQALASLEPRRSVQLRVPERLPLRCDGGLVRRVLENLVGNAIRHTPNDTVVYVSAELAELAARVTVADEGPGVPLEVREHVFEKFAASGLRRERRYHSVGLGLAFCKLAIDAHGGRIGVDPRQPKGSTFWFELPLSEDGVGARGP